MIDGGWLGRRVVVRRALTGGGSEAGTGAGRGAGTGEVMGDVVGDLVGLDPARAVVETPSGPTEIDRATIVLAKLVPASTADILALEAVAAAGWRPRETETVDGWRLRADAGWTSRANSALPLRSAGSGTAAAVERVRAWYAARGLPAVLAVPHPARRLLEEYLAQDTDWAPHPTVEVRTARLDHVRAGSPLPPGERDARPDDGWLAVFRGGHTPPAAVDVLTRHETVVFVSRRTQGRTVATGRGVVDDGWLGITAVEVAPDARRSGHALAVMRDLVAWGAEHGARRAYLQVSADNAAAVALYARLGFAVHHTYRYWQAPSGS